MKILYAECCGELVVPYPQKDRPRFCNCNNAAVWWKDPQKGDLAVYSMNGPRYVSVLGINNDFLQQPYPPSKIDEGEEFGCIQKEHIDAIIDRCPDFYLFKSQRSNILKFRPNFHGIAGLTFTVNGADVPKLDVPNYLRDPV